MGRSRVRTVLMSGLSSGLSCQHSLRQSRTKSKLFSNSSKGGLKQFPWCLIRWYQVVFSGNTLVSYVLSSGNLVGAFLFRSLRPQRILTEVKQTMLSSSWAIYSCGPLVNLIQKLSCVWGWVLGMCWSWGPGSGVLSRRDSSPSWTDISLVGLRVNYGSLLYSKGLFVVRIWLFNHGIPTHLGHPSSFSHRKRQRGLLILGTVLFTKAITVWPGMQENFCGHLSDSLCTF